MKTVHLEPAAYVARFYKDGSYEERDNYDAVATVLVMGTHAYILGAHGPVGRFRKELVEQLKKKGLTSFEWVRANGKVVKGSL